MFPGPATHHKELNPHQLSCIQSPCQPNNSFKKQIFPRYFSDVNLLAMISACLSNIHCIRIFMISTVGEGGVNQTIF